MEQERPAEPAFRPKTFGPGIHVLYADGACDGNPGPASFAAVLFDDGGREVERASGPIGKATNNIAEYVALQRGLECALARGVRRIHVLMDSELVVRQMSGQYRVKHPNLKKLYAAVEPLRKRFAHFAISYVPRHLNGLADRLAAAALKGK
ncbi:ribonuclease HI family protein [bacterium]|nr:ribonuclease HI family protein [bacterium]